MTKSYLVRIFDVLESGVLVGRVTEVESGVAKVFRDTDDLVRFLGAGTDQQCSDAAAMASRSPASTESL